MFSLFKKSIKENIIKEEFEPILTKLIELLYKSSNNAQAEWVEKIKFSLLSNDLDGFKKKLISVDMWGGSGSVWEVGGFITDLDDQEFMLELIKLLDLIKKSGIKSRGAQSRMRILKKQTRI